jgi:hypothetical protein
MLGAVLPDPAGDGGATWSHDDVSDKDRDTGADRPTPPFRATGGGAEGTAHVSRGRRATARPGRR